MLDIIINFLITPHYTGAELAILPLLGGLAAGVGLFQNIAGTPSKSQSSQRSFTEFRPEDIGRLENLIGQMDVSQRNLFNQLTASKQNLQGMQIPGTTFGFSQEADPVTRAIASLGAQGLGEQASAQRQAIASQFRGQPGTSNVLQAQANIQSRLQQNPLLFQAFQQQQGRELAQAQQQLMQQQAANEALLGREQALVGLTQMPLSTQQNLFELLRGYSTGRGVQVGGSSSVGRTGGLSYG